MGVREAVKDATLRVIAAEGVRAVTIRRVAAELGRSTTVVTHYFVDRSALLRESVDEALAERQAQIESRLESAEDPLWVFLDWSIEADPAGVWGAIVTAARTGIEPDITERARSFEQWWGERLLDLIAGQCVEGRDPLEVAAAVGVVVDGMMLGLDASSVDPARRRRLLRLLVEPMFVPTTSSERPTRRSLRPPQP